MVGNADGPASPAAFRVILSHSRNRQLGEQLGKAGKLGNRQSSYLAEALGRAATFFLESGPYSLTNFETWLEEAVGAGNPRLSPHIVPWEA